MHRCTLKCGGARLPSLSRLDLQVWTIVSLHLKRNANCTSKTCNYLSEHLESLLFQTLVRPPHLGHNCLANSYLCKRIDFARIYTHIHTIQTLMARSKSLVEGVMCSNVIYGKLLVLLCRRIFPFALSVSSKGKQTCTVTPVIATHGEMWEKRGSLGWCVRMGVHKGKKGGWEEVRGGDGF